MLKGNSKDARMMSLALFGVLIVKFEYISQPVLVFLHVTFKQVNAGWEESSSVG